VKIAIIIVNWNSGHYLYNAVQSAINQSQPAHRIIIVDNASTDQSISLIEPLMDKVEIWAMSENLGFAAANNLAVAKLDGVDWVAFLNPDATASSDWLAALRGAVEQYPKARSFASRMLSMERPAIMDGAGDCYHISGIAWRRFYGQEADKVDAMVDKEVFGPCGGAAFYHRDSYMLCGGFDEDYFCYFEDVDLALRMQLRGMESRYIHKAVILHKGGATTGDSHDFADFYGHRNLVWTWFKGMPWWLLLPLLPIHIMANVFVIIQKIPEGRALNIARAKLQAIKGLPKVLAKRRELHAGTGISVYKRLWRLMSKSLIPR
jgi:GT2 family glycosyltransferase